MLIAACLYLGLGDDELPIAGALLGEPLEVVRCTQSDLLVPAHCECVLEGTLDAGEPFTEGPVSEFHGMYENYGAGIVATFSRLTRRSDAMFQVVLPGYHPEHCLLGGVAIAAGLLRVVRNAVPSVGEVAVGLGGAGRLHAVVVVAGAAARRGAQGDVCGVGGGQPDQAGDRGRRRHRSLGCAAGRMGRRRRG